MAFLGIDIGGSSVKVAVPQDDRAAWVGQSLPYALASPAQLVEAIRDALSLHRNCSWDGVGLCVPGLLDRRRRVVTLSVNLPGLIGVSLDDLVRDACGFAGIVTLANDAVATAYDVQTTRALAGRLLLLALGTGVGAAVLDDGVPLLVEGESPGHLGQIDVSLDNAPPIGPDGGAGGLEAYAGAGALIHRHGQNWHETIRQWTCAEPTLRALARAIRIGHALYRPDHIVLAGGVGLQLKPVLGVLESMVRLNLTSVAKANWTLTCAETAFDAARGAAGLAMRARQGLPCR